MLALDLAGRVRRVEPEIRLAVQMPVTLLDPKKGVTRRG
jgi:hypothetical protein